MNKNRVDNAIVKPGPRLTLLAFAAVLAAGPAIALAQASGATVVQGQANFTQKGNQLTITTVNGAGTRHSAINWQAFSVPQGATTRFNQPDAASTSINRVLGNDPSKILGALSSNGRLVLVNPVGITVGQGASIDTAGFTASTLRMSDADALTGRLRFDGGVPGAVLWVDGSVVAQLGDVVLISPGVNVGAAGLVRAPDGAVILAAGQTVELTGRGLEGIRMEVVAPFDTAVNFGALQGDAVGMFASNLRHSGFIRAEGAERDGNKLRLVGSRSSIVDGVVRMGRDRALADNENDKSKDDKERERERERERETDNEKDDENSAAATRPASARPAPAPAAAPTPTPAPVPAAAPTPTPAAAPAPVPVPVPIPAPAPAPAPLAMPSSPPSPGNATLQIASNTPSRVAIEAAREQEKQVISFMAQPGTSASGALGLKLDRNALGKDALQCVP